MPRLTLGHITIAVRDLDAMVAFYAEVLGFRVTDRGEAGPDSRMAFLSQDPTAHHQILLISGLVVGDHQFVLTDHVAFRTGSLDDLRAVRAKLEASGVDSIIPVTHGNAWSLYFADPEGNGLEIFVDTPFHVAQPFLGSIDLDLSDAEVEATTRSAVQDQPEFQPLAQWQQAFAAHLASDPA